MSPPSMPRPTTVTFLPSKSVFISVRQGERYSGKGAGQPGNPEARHDLGLGPAPELEVVVDRRHAKKALAVRQLEVADLDHVREAFSEEDDADDRQEQPPAGHEGDYDETDG